MGQNVSTEEGQKLADEYQVQFFETSAKSGANVENAFFTLAKDIRNRQLANPGTAAAPAGGVSLAGAAAAPGAAAPKKGCC
jgi:hypothetical protein